MGVKRAPYQIVEREMVDGNYVWSTQDDHEFYTPDACLAKARKLCAQRKETVRVHRDGVLWLWMDYVDGLPKETWPSPHNVKRKAA